MSTFYKGCLVLLAAGGIVGGAWALDTRIDNNIQKTLIPHLDYIKKELAEIKVEVKELTRRRLYGVTK